MIESIQKTATLAFGNADSNLGTCTKNPAQGDQTHLVKVQPGCKTRSQSMSMILWIVQRHVVVIFDIYKVKPNAVLLLK